MSIIIRYSGKQLFEVAPVHLGMIDDALEPLALGAVVIVAIANQVANWAYGNLPHAYRRYLVRSKATP